MATPNQAEYKAGVEERQETGRGKLRCNGITEELAEMTENSEDLAEMDDKGSLSIKRQRFSEFVLVCSSATKAAIAAGYSEKSAHVTACRLLKDANVQTEISRLRLIAAEKADIQPEDIIYGLRFDIDGARERGHDTAVMNGWKMLGQYRAMWRDSLDVRESASEEQHHRNFAVFALSGSNGDRALARQIFRGFMLKLGSDAVFDSSGRGLTDEDIDTLLNEVAGH